MTGRPVLVGLTGPIGCGKSTVARWLAEVDGVDAIDADEVARVVLDPGTAEVDAVYRRFGGHLRRDDGSLDRSALGRIVFADPTALADLEGIVHPAVRRRIVQLLDAARGRGDRAVVIEAIKLIEGGLADLCDEIWLVTCDREAQLERLLERGMSVTDAEARIIAQAGLEARARTRAPRTIETGGDPASTRIVVQSALSALLDRPTEAPP